MHPGPFPAQAISSPRCACASPAGRRRGSSHERGECRCCHYPGLRVPGSQPASSCSPLVLLLTSSSGALKAHDAGRATADANVRAATVIEERRSSFEMTVLLWFSSMAKEIRRAWSEPLDE